MGEFPIVKGIEGDVLDEGPACCEVDRSVDKSEKLAPLGGREVDRCSPSRRCASIGSLVATELSVSVPIIAVLIPSLA